MKCKDASTHQLMHMKRIYIHTPNSFHLVHALIDREGWTHLNSLMAQTKENLVHEFKFSFVSMNSNTFNLSN